MLKGEVFGKQLFENQIFALFINTFLNGNNGVCGDYLNGMEVTYSGSNLTVDSGAVCIQGRFLEEDTSTTIAASTSNLFCKLVIEIDLDKVNTDDSFEQGYYKIVTSSSNYPTLTQTNIVGTNSGVYQYELARFKTTANGITDFVDKRTFLDVPTIYDTVTQMVEDAINSIEDGSAFVLKTDYEGDTLFENDLGSFSIITLNESVANYDYIEIYYKSVNESNVSIASNITKVETPNNKSITLLNPYSGSTYLYFYVLKISILNDTITCSNYSRVVIGTSGVIKDILGNLLITKVVGYKY